MIDAPRTIEEARKYRYNCWAGNPDGEAYDSKYCAHRVPERGRSCLSYQCRYKNGKGINGLYCGIHAKEVK